MVDPVLIVTLPLDAAAGAGTLAGQVMLRWISDHRWRRPGVARTRRLQEVVDLVLIEVQRLDAAADAGRG